jgi:glycine cleavage system aminomethyltransferase T
MVVNGACKYKDMDHFKKYMNQFKMDVKMDYQGDRQLVALQGKGAHIVVGRLAPKIDLSKFIK